MKGSEEEGRGSLGGWQQGYSGPDRADDNESGFGRREEMQEGKNISGQGIPFPTTASQNADHHLNPKTTQTYSKTASG